MNRTKLIWVTTSVYLAIGACWIFFSDLLVLELFGEEVSKMSYFQTAKGWFYVLSTSILLFALLKLYAKSIEEGSKLQVYSDEARVALVKRENFFKSIIDNAHDGVIVCGFHHEIVFVSPSVYKILGFHNFELMGKPIIQLFPETEDIFVSNSLEQIAPSVESVRKLKINCLNKSGNTIVLDLLISFTFLSDGKLQCVLNFRDITESIERERWMQFRSQILTTLSSSDRKRILIELAYQLADVTAAGSIEIWTKSVDATKMRLAGFYSTHTKVGECPVVFAEQGEDVFNALELVLAQGNSHPIEIGWRKNNLLQELNEQFDYRYMLPIQGKQNILGVILFHFTRVADCRIFEKIKSEILPLLADDIEKYKLSYQLDSIMQVIKDMICITTIDGQLIWFNPAFANELGLESKELLGKNVFDFVTQDNQTEEDPYGFRASGSTVSRYENKLVKTSGEVVWVSWISVLDPSEQLVISSVRDISDFKEREVLIHQMNKDLTKRAKELELSNNVLERFAYIISHDLQEPLRMVASFLDLLVKNYSTDLDEKATKYVSYASDGAKRMSEMINGLLAYSRISGGRSQFEKIDFNELITNSLILLRLEIDRSGAQVNYDFQCHAYGVRSLLNQLLTNLISNAIKYCVDGKPIIEVSTVEEGEYVRLTVRDNGKGVSDLDKERIFQIFQRGHDVGEIAGSGLGLAICKRIAEIHGGRIWLESNDNMGTDFHVLLPNQVQSHRDVS